MKSISYIPVIKKNTTFMLQIQIVCVVNKWRLSHFLSLFLVAVNVDSKDT